MDLSPHGKGGWPQACLLKGLLLCLGACASASVKGQNVSNAGNLSFGTFAVGSAGTVTVQPTGARSRTGGVYLLNQGSVAVAAQFSIKGKRNTAYVISLPANNTVYLSNGAGQTMGVNAFVSSNPSGGVLQGNGNGQFSVGATLSVGASQARGSYSGTFNVTVNYQ